MRALEHLQLCKPCERPSFIPRAKLKGLPARGIGYERKVGKSLKRIWTHTRSGIWFEYFDANGKGWCQPDHYVVLARQILLVECKLSEKDLAWDQMRWLYAPILEMHYKLPVTRVQACKILRSRRAIIVDVREALAQPGGEFLWHHLG